MSERYLKAAKILNKETKTLTPSYLQQPLLFLILHSIELGLKGVLFNNGLCIENTHKFSVLFNKIEENKLFFSQSFNKLKELLTTSLIYIHEKNGNQIKQSYDQFYINEKYPQEQEIISWSGLAPETFIKLWEISLKELQTKIINKDRK